ncbi:hypothetical protein J31TS4_23660 [Paenibacillus sp. J31TS4]|nr:hypothetical protein J31TS4_23660 [Paenibacillus sp. J31TS4]
MEVGIAIAAVAIIQTIPSLTCSFKRSFVIFNQITLQIYHTRFYANVNITHSIYLHEPVLFIIILMDI